MITYCCILVLSFFLPWCHPSGPDSSRIYEVDGYDYLAEEFPKLDYMNRCYIVDEEGLVENNVSEEEL